MLLHIVAGLVLGIQDLREYRCFYGGLSMQIDVRLEGLVGKHAHLEQKIEEETKRLLPDTLQISELKRRKLRIKDEIYRIRNT